MYLPELFTSGLQNAKPMPSSYLTAREVCARACDATADVVQKLTSALASRANDHTSQEWEATNPTCYACWANCEPLPGMRQVAKGSSRRHRVVHDHQRRAVSAKNSVSDPMHFDLTLCDKITDDGFTEGPSGGCVYYTIIGLLDLEIQRHYPQTWTVPSDFKVKKTDDSVFSDA